VVLKIAVGLGALVGRDGALRRPRSAMADRIWALRLCAWWPWGGLEDSKTPERPALAGRGRPIRLRIGFGGRRAGRPYLDDGRVGICPRHLEASSWVV